MHLCTLHLIHSPQPGERQAFSFASKQTDTPRAMTSVKNGKAHEFNKLRLDTYKELASDFLHSKPINLSRFITLFMDLKWPEIPFAFAKAICEAVKSGLVIRPTLAEEFRCIVVMAVGTAFGSVRRSTTQPFFLQNLDIFYAKMTQHLITEFKNEEDTKNPLVFKSCVNVILQLVEGSMDYHSLGFVPFSTPIHAFLVANDRHTATHMRNGHLQIGHVPKLKDEHHDVPLTKAHRLLVEFVSKKILKEENRNVDNWERAFGYFVGSQFWRSLAWRCRVDSKMNPLQNYHYNWMLEREIMKALQSPVYLSQKDKTHLEEHQARVRLSKKRARKEKEESGSGSGGETDWGGCFLSTAKQNASKRRKNWSTGPEAEEVFDTFIKKKAEIGGRNLIEKLEAALTNSV